jgi:hypothetical protein
MDSFRALFGGPPPPPPPATYAPGQTLDQYLAMAKAAYVPQHYGPTPDEVIGSGDSGQFIPGRPGGDTYLGYFQGDIENATNQYYKEKYAGETPVTPIAPGWGLQDWVPRKAENGRETQSWEGWADLIGFEGPTTRPTGYDWINGEETGTGNGWAPTTEATPEFKKALAGYKFQQTQDKHGNGIVQMLDSNRNVIGQQRVYSGPGGFSQFVQLGIAALVAYAAPQMAAELIGAMGAGSAAAATTLAEIGAGATVPGALSATGAAAASGAAAAGTQGVMQGKDTGDILESMATGAVLGGAGSQLASFAPTDLTGTGNALLNQTATDVLKGAATGAVGAVAKGDSVWDAALVGGASGGANSLVSSSFQNMGFKTPDVNAALKVLNGIKNENYLDVLNGANQFINSPDITLASKAATLVKAVESNNPTAIFNAGQAFGNSMTSDAAVKIAQSPTRTVAADDTVKQLENAGFVDNTSSLEGSGPIQQTVLDTSALEGSGPTQQTVLDTSSLDVLPTVPTAVPAPANVIQTLIDNGLITPESTDAEIAQIVAGDESTQSHIANEASTAGTEYANQNLNAEDVTTAVATPPSAPAPAMADDNGANVQQAEETQAANRFDEKTLIEDKVPTSDQIITYLTENNLVDTNTTEEDLNKILDQYVYEGHPSGTTLLDTSDLEGSGPTKTPSVETPPVLPVVDSVDDGNDDWYDELMKAGMDDPQVVISGTKPGQEELDTWDQVMADLTTPQVIMPEKKLVVDPGLPDDNLDPDNIPEDEVLDTSSLEGDGSNADDLLGGEVIDTSSLEGDGTTGTDVIDTSSLEGDGKTPVVPTTKAPPPPAKTPAPAKAPSPSAKAPAPSSSGLDIATLLNLLTAGSSGAAMNNPQYAKAVDFDINSFFQDQSPGDMDKLLKLLKKRG